MTSYFANIIKSRTLHGSWQAQDRTKPREVRGWVVSGPAAKMTELRLRDLGSVKDGPTGGAELSLKCGAQGTPFEGKGGEKRLEIKTPI